MASVQFSWVWGCYCRYFKICLRVLGMNVCTVKEEVAVELEVLVSSYV